jgi:hypothetical protein
MSTVSRFRLVFLLLAYLLVMILIASIDQGAAEAGPALAQDHGTPITILGTGASFPAPYTRDGSASTTSCIPRYRSISRRSEAGQG